MFNVCASAVESKDSERKTRVVVDGCILAVGGCCFRRVKEGCREDALIADCGVARQYVCSSIQIVLDGR